MGTLDLAAVKEHTRKVTARRQSLQAGFCNDSIVLKSLEQIG